MTESLTTRESVITILTLAVVVGMAFYLYFSMLEGRVRRLNRRALVKLHSFTAWLISSAAQLYDKPYSAEFDPDTGTYTFTVPPEDRPSERQIGQIEGILSLLPLYVFTYVWLGNSIPTALKDIPALEGTFVPPLVSLLIAAALFFSVGLAITSYLNEEFRPVTVELNRGVAQ